MKPEASTSVKATDKQLAKVQTLLLDSLAPLTSVVEAHYNGDPFDEKEVLQAVKAAVQLVGNANAHMSHLRRERVVTDLNKALLPIVGDDEAFAEAAPLLFGTEFAKKGKEMIDQVKAMRATISKKQEKRPFFRGGPPRQLGGFQPKIWKGRSPKLPLQGPAIQPERPIPRQPKETTELNLLVSHVHSQRDVCKNTLTNQLMQVGIVPTAADNLPPAGRLKGHINTWKVITNDPWVLNTVRGYRVDFLSKPQQRVLPHAPQYSVEQSQLIVEEVKELLGKGAITEVCNPRGGFYSNIFLVPRRTEVRDR